VLGAGEAVAIVVWAAVCGGEGSLSEGEVGGDEMELGAGAGRRDQGCQMSASGVAVGSQARKVRAGVSEDAGTGLAGSSDRAGRGGVCGRGERHRSSSTPTPLSNLTSQRLFATFLVCFTGGGEGASGDSGSEGWGGGGSGGGGSGRVGGGTAGTGEEGALGSDRTAALAA
jgi:hypothetical protein